MRIHTITLPDGTPLVLPIVDLRRGEAISLLMCNDISFDVLDGIIDNLFQVLKPHNPEAIVGIPEQGIPLAHGVARRFGHERVYILRKTPKLFESYHRMTYRSVTKGDQCLYLPKYWVDLLKDKRIAVVEDVINTGGTIDATLRLFTACGLVVGVVALVLTEGYD